MSRFNQIAAKHLGTANTYAVDNTHFQPDLLVRLPRALARQEQHITSIPFIGYDIWHAHEATCLTARGLPVSGTLKICYPASGAYIVESKSMKLYLNSFDMCVMGTTLQEAALHYERQIQKDLSELLETEVQVGFHERPQVPDTTDIGADFEDLYTVLEQRGQLESLSFSHNSSDNFIRFTPQAKHLYEDKYYTHILRARCRITRQKDSGYAYCQISSQDARIDPGSLLQQMVALREQEEFHEFCAEKLFAQIKAHPCVSRLCIMLLFARRGAIDINPVRSTHPELIPPLLTDVRQYTPKTPIQ